MKTKYLIFAISSLLSLKAFSQNYQWAKQQDAGGTNDDYAQSVATDANGNVIVTGSFNSQTITFGTITLTNSGDYDIFIVKYDPNGNVLWAKQQDGGGVADDYANSIAVDGSGNIIITGKFYSPSMTFGTTTLTNAGTFDIFTVKYEPNGNVVWAKQQDGGGTSDDEIYSITIDPTGNNVIIMGQFLSSSITFGTTTLTNAGGADIFIVKYDPNGNVVWAKQQDGGGTANDYPSSVIADVSGNVIATGYFNGTSITFGTTTLTNTGSLQDFFIVKYEYTGDVLWAKQQDGGGGDSDYVKSVTTDYSGNVIVAGYYRSPTITFGTTTLTNSGTDNIFIVKYDLNGNAVWAKQQDSGGGSGDYASSITTDADQNIIVTGAFFSPTITFGTTILSGSDYDIFIVKYDPSGNVLWAKQQNGGGASNDYPNSIAADVSGNVIVVGKFLSPTITFGTTTLTKAGVLHDIFILKLTNGITGTEENTLNNELNLYPNPTGGLILLSTNYDVTLTDLAGKIITKAQNVNTIDISNQSEGMYFLLLSNDKGEIVQRTKVMKE